MIRCPSGDWSIPELERRSCFQDATFASIRAAVVGGTNPTRAQRVYDECWAFPLQGGCREEFAMR